MSYQQKRLKDWTDADYKAWAQAGAESINGTKNTVIFNRARGRFEGAVDLDDAALITLLTSLVIEGEEPAAAAQETAEAATSVESSDAAPAPVVVEGTETVDPATQADSPEVERVDSPVETPTDTRAELDAVPDDLSGPNTNTPRVATAKANTYVPMGKLDTETLVRSEMEAYLKEMAPGKAIAAERVVELQLRLWRVIKRVLGSEGGQFSASFGYMLNIFAENDTKHFHVDRIMRGFNKIGTRMPAREFNAFRNMLDTMKLLANPATRKMTLTQTDLPYALRHLGEDEQGKVRAYFEGL